jgi:hypothetical protein
MQLLHTRETPLNRFVQGMIWFGLKTHFAIQIQSRGKLLKSVGTVSWLRCLEFQTKKVLRLRELLFVIWRMLGNAIRGRASLSLHTLHSHAATGTWSCNNET